MARASHGPARYAPGALKRFLIAFLIPVLTFAWLLFAIARSRHLFALRVRKGKIVTVKGRIPPSAVGELGDVFADTDTNGTLTGSTENGRVRVDFSGRISGNVLQRARNVVGLFPLSRYKGQAPR
jgi:Protein of unknown function (DUF3634)